MWSKKNRVRTPLPGARLAVLKQLDCGRGLDTGVVALVKQKEMH